MNILLNLKKKFSNRGSFKNALLVGSFFVLVFVGVVTILNVKDATPAEASWLDENWEYRARIVTNKNTTGSVWFQRINLAIDTSTPIAIGRMQSDCGDSRFTDAEGAMLPYFIASGCNTTTTQYWILANNINAGTAPTVFFHYYGNPTAPNGTRNAQFNETQYTPASSSIGTATTGPGPQMFLRMDEGVSNTCTNGTNDVCDSLSNANDGAISNGTTWYPPENCINGTCLFFDGSNDIVTVTNASTIDMDQQMASGFMYQFWIKPTGVGEAGEVFNKGTNTYVRVNNLQTDASAPDFLKMDVAVSLDLATADATLTATDAITMGKWHHVAVGYSDDSDDEVSLYVDGNLVRVSTNGDGAPASDSNNLVIGGGTSTNYLGFIDEFRIYNYERSTAQIAVDTNMSSISDGGGAMFGAREQKFLSDELAGYWRLDEGTGTSTTDRSGFGLTGTLTSGASWATGRFDTAGRFDGTSDYLAIADSASLSLDTATAKTWSMWINPSSTSAEFQTVWSQTVSSTERFVIYAHTTSNSAWGPVTNGISAGWDNGSSNRLIAHTSDSVISAGSWAHITVTYDASQPQSQRLKIYVNGIDRTSTSDIQSDGTITPFDPTNTRAGGNAPSGEYFPGSIDDIRFYHRMYSPKEVEDLYMWGPGPTGWWTHDNSTGSITYDRSTNEFNGSPSSGTISYKPGKYGTAIEGAAPTGNTYAELPALGSPDILSMGSYPNLTMMLWVYRYGTANNRILMGRKTSTSIGDRGFWLYEWSTANDGNTCLYVSDGTDQYETCTANTSADLTGTWQHIAVVFDRSGDAASKIYINGVDAEFFELGTSATLVNDIALSGSEEFRLGDATAYGLVDDARIYRYALTQRQIQEAMNAGHPLGGSPNPSPVLHLKFDEKTGYVANNTNNLFTSLSASLGTGDSAPTWLYPHLCRINDCLDFDGSNDSLSVATSMPIDFDDGLANEVTFTSWVFPDGAGEGTGGQIFQKGTNTYLRVSNLSGTSLTLDGSLDLGTTDATLSVTAALNASAWSHVALSYTDDSDDEITLWVNGKAVGSSTNGVGSPATDANALLVGGTTTNNFDGRIDEFKIYNSEMTSSEIRIDRAQGAAAFGGLLATNGQVATGWNGGSPPVAWWKLDENTGTTVYNIGSAASSNAAGGSIMSTSQLFWTNGRVGSGLQFLGTNNSSYVNTQIDPIDETAAYSVSFMANISTLGTRFLLSNGSSPWGIYTNTNGSLAMCNDTACNIGTSQSAIIAANQWFHGLVTYSGANVIRWYLNGVNMGNDTTGSETAQGGTINMGISGSNNTLVHIGRLDNVKFFNYALDASQVWFDYTNGVLRPFKWWKFDECEGIIAYNSGASGRVTETANRGTLTFGTTGNNATGSCNSGTATEMWNDGTEGKYNSALGFDGISDYVTIANSVEIDMNIGFLSGFTIAAWIKPYGSSGPLGGNVFSKANDTYLSVGTGPVNGNFNIWARVDLTTDAQYIANSSVPGSAWSHVALSWSDDADDEITVWVNGVPNTSVGLFSGAHATENNAFQIGANIGPDNYFDGLIDDVQMYPFELNAAQIQQVMNQNASARWGPLTGYPGGY